MQHPLCCHPQSLSQAVNLPFKIKNKASSLKIHQNLGAIYVHALGESNMYPYLHGDDSVLVSFHSLLLGCFFVHKTAEKDHNNHRLEFSLAKPHYWKRDEMATLSQTFPHPWARKWWFKKTKRSWKHEKGEENKINGCDLGDISPGDKEVNVRANPSMVWFGLEGALQIQSPAMDRDTFHWNKDNVKRLLHFLSAKKFLWVNTPNFFSKPLKFLLPIF